MVVSKLPDNLKYSQRSVSYQYYVTPEYSLLKFLTVCSGSCKSSTSSYLFDSPPFLNIGELPSLHIVAQ